MLKKCLLLIGIVVVSFGCSKKVSHIPEKKEVKEIMTMVCDYELKNVHLADNWQRFILNSWIPSSFYPGLMAQYRVSHDEKYLKMAELWAGATNYTLAPRFRHADDHLCGSTYLDLYEIEGKDYMLAPTKEQFDSILKVNTMSGREDWHWADALFMAPPTWAKLGRITGDRRYYDFLNTQFFDAITPIYDKEDSLFYRDKRFIEKRSANGKKIFWARGNGWVVAGLARILKNLPPDDPYRGKYEELLKEMSTRLLELQGDDGMWRASLLDPVEFPMKESSGTAFFCYGMAWGINNGILDKDQFLPAVLNAWEGLCQSVNDYGRLCYVQPGGASPVEFPERYTNAYAVGGFLLAGEQMIELFDNI
ncbi:MAG TPA: glycoside hydrolase family 88 protein [Bacteroidales bacterium]|nr:glycoside hydrolase family 88 protein [Bacteroidales bacterium]